MKLWRIAFMMLAALSLASCSSDDDDKDITKEIIMNVSAEPGVMYDLFDSMGEHPIMFGHHRQSPGANRLPYTEDTETSIGFYYSRNS